jgi:hypothetical protein
LSGTQRGFIGVGVAGERPNEAIGPGIRH